MATTVFLKKFTQGEDIAIPFEETMSFLSKYAKKGDRFIFALVRSELCRRAPCSLIMR